ncbi:ABC transporter permease [Pseudodesulfovibrio sp. zrk46]|uniref:ABC transporter permease n=1 Tax=Pseudodesulfovibrio sp. zrk46 TaxID=2725288 RepID=UPI001FFDC30E|nr:ABC transporter permease [Pseudodesulfovibrio sp. zrk46]
MSDRTLPTGHPGASITSTPDSQGIRLDIQGHLDAAGTAYVWDDAVNMIQSGSGVVTADCSNITYMDGTGLALLLKIREEAARTGHKVALTNLREEYQKLIKLTWECDLPQWTTKTKERRGIAEAVGRATGEVLDGIREMVSFVGESAVMIAFSILHPRQVRWKDVLLSCIHVGVDSLFIITLIGFVMGLIMSFQSAVTLEKFGGEIFIPNMLGLVMFREMGPLVTSILLAARSGSAFAAEIGTMKVNEELDALTTMGLSPMRFLVMPRLLSTLMMVPIMTLYFNLASLVGGAVVMVSIGFPLVTFTSRVFSYVDFLDFWGGMLKAVTFALLVAGVGCLRGIQTKESASAVGLSTTSAVVSGIILIAFADGLFAVAFYYMGW